MAYVIKLFVLTKHWDGKIKNQEDEQFQIEVRNLLDQPRLESDEKIMPLSYWRRGLPRSAAEIVRKMEGDQEIIGMDFAYKVNV